MLGSGLRGGEVGWRKVLMMIKAFEMSWMLDFLLLFLR